MACDYTNLYMDRNNVNVTWSKRISNNSIFGQRFTPSNRCLNTLILKLKRLPGVTDNLIIEIKDDSLNLLNQSVPSDIIKTYRGINFDTVSETIETDISIPLNTDLCDITKSYWIIVYNENYDPQSNPNDTYDIYGSDSGSPTEYETEKIGTIDWQVNQNQNLYYITTTGTQIPPGDGMLQINSVTYSPQSAIAGDTVTISVNCTNVSFSDQVSIIVNALTTGQAGPVTFELFNQSYMNNETCNELLNNTDWLIDVPFTMTDIDTTIEVISYHKNIEDQRKSIMITPSLQTCSTATITYVNITNPPSQTDPNPINNEGDLITFTMYRDPPIEGDVGYLIEKTIDTSGNIIESNLGTCISDVNGYCYLDWISSINGTHIFYTKFDSGCISSDILIDVGIPQPPATPTLLELLVNNQSDIVFINTGEDISITVTGATPDSLITINDVTSSQGGEGGFGGITEINSGMSDSIGIYTTTISSPNTMDIQATDGLNFSNTVSVVASQPPGAPTTETATTGTSTTTKVLAGVAIGILVTKIVIDRKKTTTLTSKKKRK